MGSDHKHRRTQQLIRRLFSGQLPPEKVKNLHAELEQCPICAAYYRRHHQLESALGENDQGVSPLALERVEQMVLAQVRPRKKRSLTLGFLLPAVAAAAAAAFIVVVPEIFSLDSGSKNATQSQEFHSKGVEESGSDTGIRLFRVVDQGQAPSHLTTQSVITFSYTNVADAVGYLMIFGIQRGHPVQWYHPSDAQGQSQAIDSNCIDNPLGDGFALGSHHLGRLRVVALFSSQPLRSQQVLALINTRITEEQLGSDEPLFLSLLPAVFEHTIWVDVVDRGEQNLDANDFSQ